MAFLFAEKEEHSIIMSVGDKVTVILAEMVGTAILMFVGCMSNVNTLNSASSSFEASNFTFGFAVMLVIQVRATSGVGYADISNLIVSDLRDLIQLTHL